MKVIDNKNGSLTVQSIAAGYYLKFDKEMIWQATKEEKASVALNYVIKMRKELGLEIVAEGVETEEQAQQLKKAGCDLFQGYLYAKPMPKEQFIDFLDHHH